MSYLNSPVLVLNKAWIPIRVISVKRALKLVFADRASIVDHDNFVVCEWDVWAKFEVPEDQPAILTTRGGIRVPEVIVLMRYDKIDKKSIRLTKKNLFIRDGFICQYTGKKVSEKEADIDHIIPKSKGGKSTWDNMVVCSKHINRKKGDRTPHEAGLKLIKEPKKPSAKTIWIDPRIKIPQSWNNFLQHG